MASGITLEPGAGQLVSAGMTLKIGAAQTAAWSAFEAVIPPGFDVGAHIHAAAEELFYVLDGELDLLAFEPVARTAADWSGWVSPAGQRVLRAGPGALMYVPARCPHAFANRGQVPARMLFLVTPAGHEHYLAELAQVIAGQTAQGGQAPPPDVISAVRARHDIEQITPLIPAHARDGGAHE